MVANSSDFFALASLKRDKVDVEGQTIHIRELSVKERAKLLETVDKEPGMASAFLVRCCVTDESGKPLFKDSDTDALASSAPGVVDAVAAAVMRLSGMRNDPNA